MKFSVKLVIILLLTCLLFFSLTSCAGIMGDKNCIIAYNYSSIRMYDNEYLSLQLGDLYFTCGEVLIEEARVEGVGFLDKLLFGDSIYAVQGCANNDLIYLITDYDDPPSEIYCLAEKVDYYEKIIAEFEETELFYETVGDDLEYTDRPMDKELSALLASSGMERNAAYLECTGVGDFDFMAVKAFGDDKIFYKEYGNFLYQNGEYYWNDVSKATYIIPDEYDTVMDEYFSYMFK